jgi:copper transport protein
MLVLAAAERTVAGPSASAAMARSAARLGEWGALLLAVSAVLRLLMQSVVVRGAATVPSGVSLEGIIAGTTWGHGWLLQIAALVVVAIGFRLARGAASARAGWAIASIAAIVLAFTPGFGGHAAAAGPLAMTIDGMHVLAAGGWLGSLFVLLVAGIPAALALPADERNRVLAALVNAFSPTALLFAALLLGSGALAGWRNLGSIGALTHSRYGRVLLLKLGALALVALAGLYNWRRARPALGAGNDATRIRRTMRAELVAGAMVLLVTAVLVAIPTPADLAE